MKLIVDKISFILNLSFHSIDSVSIFFAISKFSCVGGTVLFFKGSSIEGVISELSLKFLSIGIDEFAVISMF